MRNAYCDLVRDPRTRWKASDLDEDAAYRQRGADAVVVRSPEQDAMGVVACAVGVMRYVITDTFLQKHSLNMTTRYHLAAILFAVYKLKTEDRWDNGSCMTMQMLEHFMLEHELDGDWRTCTRLRLRHEQIVWNAESELVAAHPFSTLVDYGVHGCFEVALEQLLQCDVVSEDEATLAMGLVGFHLHAATANARHDLLEELGRERSTAEIGAVFALLTVVSIRIRGGKIDTAFNFDAVGGVWHYDMDSLHSAALQVVLNTETVLRRRPRDGAYACPEARVYPYVTPLALSTLKTALSGEV